MKGEIVLSQKEIQRVRVMEQVMQGVLTAVDAGGYLGGRYAECNDSHFTELIAERKGIAVSRETV